MALGMGHREVIADCETGNPPEGWESEGQFQNSNFKIPNPKCALHSMLYASWILTTGFFTLLKLLLYLHLCRIEQFSGIGMGHRAESMGHSAWGIGKIQRAAGSKD